MALNVLVVDDSAVMRAMVLRTLRASGVPLGDVVQAANGREALDAVRAARVDLALVDINMPVMTGLEFITHVRGDARHAMLPIIVVSTESSETRIEHIRRYGVGFVRKPFTAEALRAEILTHTGYADVSAAGAAHASGGLGL